jgi:hypothetical protein
LCTYRTGLCMDIGANKQKRENFEMFHKLSFVGEKMLIPNVHS